MLSRLYLASTLLHIAAISGDGDHFMVSDCGDVDSGGPWIEEDVPGVVRAWIGSANATGEKNSKVF